MTRLVIENAPDGSGLLQVSFQRYIVSGVFGTWWQHDRIAPISREVMASNAAYLDPIEIAERALGGPFVQWRRRDEP